MTEQQTGLTTTSPEELIDRAQQAGKIVSRLLNDDIDKLHQAIERLEAGKPDTPVKIEFQPMQLDQSKTFPYLSRFGEARLHLKYTDGSEVEIKRQVREDDEPFNDTAISESDRYEFSKLMYQSQAGTIEAQIADFKGKLFFNDEEMPDADLTEEAVTVFEALAHRLEPAVV